MAKNKPLSQKDLKRLIFYEKFIKNDLEFADKTAVDKPEEEKTDDVITDERPRKYDNHSVSPTSWKLKLKDFVSSELGIALIIFIIGILFNVSLVYNQGRFDTKLETFNAQINNITNSIKEYTDGLVDIKVRLGILEKTNSMSGEPPKVTVSPTPQK